MDDDLWDEYEGPNVNQGRFGCGNRFGVARFGYRRGDNLGKIKERILPFQEKNDPDAYLEWEKRMELVFDCHNYSKLNKVKLATIEFTNYDIVWWDQLMLNRRRNGEHPIETWEEMKALMRKCFITNHYHQDLF